MFGKKVRLAPFPQGQVLKKQPQQPKVDMLFGDWQIAWHAGFF